MLRTLGPIPRHLPSYDFPHYNRPFTSKVKARIRNTASHSGSNCRTTSQSTSMTSPRGTRAASHMATDKGAWTTTNEGREEDILRGLKPTPQKQTQEKREPACGGSWAMAFRVEPGSVARGRRLRWVADTQSGSSTRTRPFCTQIPAVLPLEDIYIEQLHDRRQQQDLPLTSFIMVKTTRLGGTASDVVVAKVAVSYATLVPSSSATLMINSTD